MKPITSSYLGQDDDDVAGMDFDADISMELVVDNPAAMAMGGDKKQNLQDANFFNSFPDDFNDDDLA